MFLVKLLNIRQQIFQRRTSLSHKHCFVTVTELMLEDKTWSLWKRLGMNRTKILLHLSVVFTDVNHFSECLIQKIPEQ
jgi:hypothetical protein